MKDSVILGSGNSRYLKSVQDFKTLYPTYDDFAAALVAGTLPIDLNGINSAGFQQVGDALGKATLLKDTTAQKHGRDASALPDDMWADLVPIGGILWYAKDGIPDGYLKCDGSAISRVDYKRLFDVIGTDFGPGDGSTTFSLPDLRAKFIRGSGSSGNYSATFGKTQIPTQITYHDYSGNNTNCNLAIDKSSYDILGYLHSKRLFYGGSYTTEITELAYGGVRPYNISMTPIIKY